MSTYPSENYIENSLYLDCPSCGSELAYSAKDRKLDCSHCGYQEEVNPANDKVVEQSLIDAVAQMPDYIPEQSGKKVFHCSNCGAKSIVEQELVKINCGFCSSTNVNVEAYEHRYIQPVGIIPFYISREEATKIFKKWIGEGLFRPNKLAKLASVDDLHGIYLPFWTYDAHTESDWSGEAGFHYYVSESYTDGQGNRRTRQVQRTRWERRHGHLSHFFDDVLVVASKGLNEELINKILPYRLGEVVNYDPRFLVNWEAEVYDVELDNGYQKAEVIMDYKIRNMCSAQLGGDTQRFLRVSSDKCDQTFKHLILPVWICSYQYQNKLYRFVINGQTGEVHGKKPLSYFKIFFLVLFFLTVILLFILAQEGKLQFSM